MSRGYRYILHDHCGNKVGEVKLPANNLATIIIEKKGVCYRPIYYDLQAYTALCYPVKKIIVEGNDENTRLDRKPAFVGETSL